MLQEFDAAFGATPLPAQRVETAVPRTPSGFPPLDLPAGRGRRVGELVGRNIAQADVTLRGLGERIHELWDYVRAETKDAFESARAEHARNRPSRPVVAPNAPPRRRGFFARLVMAPFRLVGWVFTNLVTVVVTLLVAAALIGLTEIVLVNVIE
jgi:hypothetical protein